MYIYQMYVKEYLGCDKTLTSDTDTLESPQYPQPVTRNVECIYHIWVRRGFRIQLTVETMNLSCSDSYVEIK